MNIVLKLNLERLTTLAEQIQEHVKYVNMLHDKEEEPKSPWYPADDVPDDNQLCIVVTTSGAKFFLSPTNGKWMQNVKYWMPIPEIPEEL